MCPGRAGERGQQFEAGGEEFITGGKSIFWTDGVQALGPVETEELERREEGNRVTVVHRRRGEFEGRGRFNLDFLAYRALGLDLTRLDDAQLETLPGGGLSYAGRRRGCHVPSCGWHQPETAAAG